MNSPTPLHPYLQWQRLAYALLLFFWLLRWSQGVWFSDLAWSPFIRVKNDYWYWLLHYWEIPQTILASAIISWILDIFLVLAYSLLIWKPQQKYIAYAVSLAYMLYVVVYNTSTLHHTHSLLACFFLNIFLCFKQDKNIYWSWEVFRYYACYVMASAGLWKTLRGTAFHFEQMSNILVHQHVDYLLDHAKDFRAQVLQYLIENPLYSYLFWIGAIALELAFLIGFFTKRFDKILLICLLSFVIADFFMMDLYFWEFSLFALAFFNNAISPFSKKHLRLI